MTNKICKVRNVVDLSEERRNFVKSLYPSIEVTEKAAFVFTDPDIEAVVIATRLTGIPEVVVDGQSGLLVPERDVETLSEKICYLFDQPEECQQMCKAGRVHISEQFNLIYLHKLIAWSLFMILWLPERKRTFGFEDAR